MNFELDPELERIQKLARELAADFATRASQHDQESTAPDENYAKLKQAAADACFDRSQWRVEPLRDLLVVPGDVLGAEALNANAMCSAGYVIETRRFAQPWVGLFGNGGDVVYTGRCLQ